MLQEVSILKSLPKKEVESCFIMPLEQVYKEDKEQIPSALIFPFYTSAHDLFDEVTQSQRGFFCEKDALPLMVQILTAISYLHQHDIAHRDIKLENILFISGDDPKNPRKKAQIRLFDFGLAANIPVDTNERLLQVGSPYWMSPECLRGEFYDHKSDVFSFGIILCELIARCGADPDYLPRTANFGVDYRLFCESMVHDSCPPEFLKIAFSCVTVRTLFLIIT